MMIGFQAVQADHSRMDAPFIHMDDLACLFFHASMICHCESALYYLGWWKKSGKLWASGKGMYN